MLIMGRQDLGASFFGIKKAEDEEPYFQKCKADMPGLKAQCFMEASHFLHQEKALEVNKLILDFLLFYKTLT